MGKNYLQRIERQNDNFFHIGMDVGTQWAMDNLQLAALVYKVPTKTIANICRLAAQMMDDNHNALDCRHVEADVVQEHMDHGLRKIWGDDLVPFEQRYDMMKKCKY